MNRNKISLIGGGQIGGNLALLASQKELGDIVIYDIPNAEGMIKGKALDISQLNPLDGYDSNIKGSSNPEDLKDSDVIIITAIKGRVTKFFFCIASQILKNSKTSFQTSDHIYTLNYI